MSPDAASRCKLTTVPAGIDTLVARYVPVLSVPVQLYIGGGCCSRYLPADGKRFAGGIADGDAECRVPSDGWFP